MREVWITGAARTAIGDFGGGLKDVAPIDLGATVAKRLNPAVPNPWRAWWPTPMPVSIQKLWGLAQCQRPRLS